MLKSSSLLALLRRNRRPGDLAFAVAFFLFSALCFALLPSQTQWVDTANLVRQPRFWPGIGVTMMLGFGTVHLLSAVASERQPGRLAEVVYWARALEFVFWFLAYVWLVPWLGYLPSTVVFALLLTLRLGYRAASSFALAGGFAVAVVLIFKTGLNVKLPAGAIYAYLPEQIRTFAMVNF